MHCSINLKSVLIGGLLVALVLCLAGAVPFMHLDRFNRFKIAANDSYAFVLDSATGQVWSSEFHSPEFAPGPEYDSKFHSPKIKLENNGQTTEEDSN